MFVAVRVNIESFTKLAQNPFFHEFSVFSGNFRFFLFFSSGIHDVMSSKAYNIAYKVYFIKKEPIIY